MRVDALKSDIENTGERRVSASEIRERKEQE